MCRMRRLDIHSGGPRFFPHLRGESFLLSQCVPQDVPNNTILYFIWFAQNWKMWFLVEGSFLFNRSFRTPKPQVKSIKYQQSVAGVFFFSFFILKIWQNFPNISNLFNFTLEKPPPKKKILVFWFKNQHCGGKKTGLIKPHKEQPEWTKSHPYTIHRKNVMTLLWMNPNWVAVGWHLGNLSCERKVLYPLPG